MPPEQPRIQKDRADIRIAKKWLAHFHELHTEQKVRPEEIDHKVDKNGRVSFSLKGRVLLEPGLISPPRSFTIRAGRGDKELVIEKRNPRGVVAVLSVDGTKIHSFNPGFLTRFLLQLKINDWKDRQ